jgi:hypothetical protein
MRRVKTKGSARSWGSKAPSDPPFNEMIGKHPSAKGDGGHDRKECRKE